MIQIISKNKKKSINKNSTFNNSLRYGNTDILKKEATGKELVTAKWVRDNFTVQSPYVHTFTGTSTIIPYEKISGLKWVKLEGEVHNTMSCYSFRRTSNINCGCYDYTCITAIYMKYNDLRWCSLPYKCNNTNYCCTPAGVKIIYDENSGLFSLRTLYNDGSMSPDNRVRNMNVYFSKNGKD